MENLLLSIFAILYLTLAIRRLEWAVLLLLAALPAYMLRFSVAGIPFTLLELMILVSFAVFLQRNFKDIKTRFMYRLKHKKFDVHRSKVFRYPFAQEISLVMLLSYIAVMANFSDAALGIWKAYFFEPFLVYIMIFNVFRPMDKESPDGEPGQVQQSEPGAEKNRAIFKYIIEKTLWALAISAFTVSVVALLQRIGLVYSPINFWPRVTGPWPYPNALGLFLAPIAMLLIAWRAALWRQNGKFCGDARFWFSGITIFVSVLAIYLARSEGALIGLLAGLLVFGLFAGKLSRRLTLLAVVMAGVVVFSYAPLRIYALEKAQLKDLSGEIRKQQWRETLEMMGDRGRWLFGTGLSGYQEAIRPYHQEGIFFNKERDPDFTRKIVIFDEKYKSEHWQPVEIYMYPHNFFLNFWTELGLAGALLFVWILVKYFYWGAMNYKKQIKERKKQEWWLYINLGIICAMIVVLAHGMVDVPYFKNDLAVLFWLLVAMAGAVRLAEAEKAKTKK